MNVTLEDVVQAFLDKKGSLIIDNLVDIGFCSSKADAKRMIAQGSVKVDNKQIRSPQARSINFDGSIIVVDQLPNGMINIIT